MRKDDGFSFDLRPVDVFKIVPEVNLYFTVLDFFDRNGSLLGKIQKGIEEIGKFEGVNLRANRQKQKQKGEKRGAFPF